jgi:hypothetical protein
MMVVAFFAGMSCCVAEKLVKQQERFVSPPDTALCRFHLYASPAPQSWAK